MRKFMTIAMVAAALTVVAPAAAQDTTKDIETLRGLILEQARAINAHDPDGVLKHYSRDIIVSYPGIPDTTYTTFETNYRRMMNPSITTQSAPTVDEILVTITDKATGKATSRQAKDLQVWRRENGAWKFYRGMWHHIWPDAPKPAQIAISVPSLDLASQWYQQMLGLVVRDDRRFPEAKLRVAFLERQGIRVELVEMQGSVSKASVNSGLENPAMVQGFGKVGFVVADVDSWAGTLRSKGVRFQLEPLTDPQTGARSFIVLDNNGNWLQFSSQ
jgi:ketosteroid isomerase-like protein/catechol 2,3-dioxygenase-like lactoylglutathione lyase family enzyme